MKFINVQITKQIYRSIDDKLVLHEQTSHQISNSQYYIDASKLLKKYSANIIQCRLIDVGFEINICKPHIWDNATSTS